MRKLFFISCTKSKKDYCTTAKELYSPSDLFRKHMAYAEMKAKKGDIIFILSAKYGLLQLDDVKCPYELTLNTMKKAERKEWAKKVLEQLQGIADFEHDQAVFLAGKPYYQDLLNSFTISPNIPGKGLSFGRKLSFLKNELLSQASSSPKNICHEIHKLVHTLKRYSFEFDCDTIPTNGICILFEKGEIGHQGNRIVYIGTHTGQGRLVNRLKEHFIVKKKDRSILRKNIGRALLARNNDPFLKQWNWDLTSKAKRDQFLSQLNTTKQKETENSVSQYMQGNFSFCVLNIPTNEERCRINKFLIQTISSCKECTASSHWLGLSSPIPNIVDSSLWLTQHTSSLPSAIINIETIKKYAAE